ncbi:plasmid mobilization protein [Rhodospirillum centenum]|nr:hypothetical protein [Rhodospirillum centenum]
MAMVERATERVTVLMTPTERQSLERKAAAAGVTISDLVRRSVDGYDPDAQEEMRQLAALAVELDQSNRAAARALDDALEAVAATLAEVGSRRRA